MAGIAHGQPPARRIVSGQNSRRHHGRALLIEASIQPVQNLPLVDDVHAAPEVRVHLGADGRHGRAMSRHIRQAHPGEQA